jgi:hypothetical protein
MSVSGPKLALNNLSHIDQEEKGSDDYGSEEVKKSESGLFNFDYLKNHCNSPSLYCKP